MQITERTIAGLIEAEYNPRKISEDQMRHLVDSMKRLGVLEPAVINMHPERKNIIVSGHQRLKAAIKAGMTRYPCYEVEFSLDQEREANIRMNQNGGEFDPLALTDFFKVEELADWGFSSNYTDDLLDLVSSQEEKEPLTDEDAVPDAPPEPKTKLGDIYQLGDHRLMCGSATIQTDCETLMDGVEADLVVTDPPYNVAVNDESEESLKKRNRRSDGFKIENDNMSEEDFNQFLADVFGSYYSLMSEGASIYVFYADSMTIPFMSNFIEADFHFAQNCIWNKQQFVMTRKDFHYKHEPIMYGWKKGAAHNWHTDRKQSSVWDFDRPFRNPLHPTMKPIELIEYPIECSSKQRQIVLDLFGGSGSTMIACEKTNRHCRMMELDPKYCDVIVQRWEEYTGKKAELLTG